jgi:hypothetical protein
LQLPPIAVANYGPCWQQCPVPITEFIDGCGSPVTVAVVGEDGRDTSARIEVVTASGVMQ